MALKKINHRKTVSSRRGFTLVEMLISVTLVLLMMTMFTSIFQMATSTVSVQRGVAGHNQKVREFTTSIRADIAKRTNRYCQPYYPTELAATSPTPFGPRSGYIYISTNNPDSGQDDIIQFTVDASQALENPDDTAYFGAAALLYDLVADPAFENSARATTLRFNPNQPDADDSNLSANGVMTSSAAEISYFIRNGNLYRRVMLLREPIPVAGEELSIQPTSSMRPTSTALPPTFLQVGPTHSATEFGGTFAYVASPLEIAQSDSSLTQHFALAVDETAPIAWNVTASNNFWQHFDISATPVWSGGATNLPTTATMIGIGALDNSLTGAGAVSVGIPAFRFGFNPLTGLSREHDNPVDLVFIGRFTQAETSHHHFNYPLAASRIEANDTIGNVGSDASTCLNNINLGTDFLGDDGSGGDGNGNPMDLVGTHLNLNQETGVLSELQGATGRGGGRRVEDLLLANVHGMKIEIWDERLQRYVSPSHSSLTQIVAGGSLSTIAGDFHSTRNLNATYGPVGTLSVGTNAVFDTWNPTLGPSAPFIPYRYYPPRQSDSPPGPSPASAPDPSSEPDRETGIAQNQGYWVPSDYSDPMAPVVQNYAVGDIVFAVPAQYATNGIAGWDADGDGAFEWGRGAGGDQDNTIQIPAGSGITNVGFPAQGFQIAYRCISAGSASDVPPTWPTEPGQRTAETNGTGGTAIWESIDNRRPLQSIKMTVQFFDPKTETLRQLSLELPLTTDR